MGHGVDGPKPSGKAYEVGQVGVYAPYGGALFEEAGIRNFHNTFWSLESVNEAVAKLNALNKGVFEARGHHNQGLFDAYPGR
jgi:hypothetical protein